MSAILLVVGILVTGAGVLAVGFGIPINEFSLGNTLIIAGTTALAAGLILIGLAAAVSQLTTIAEALRARPTSRPAQLRTPVDPSGREAFASEAPIREPRAPEARPGAEPALNVSASAIERLRSSIPRPEKVVAEPEEVPLSPGAVQPTAQNEAVQASAREAGVKTPRLDFLFRSKASSAPAEPQSFESLWPKRARGAQGAAKGEAPGPMPAERPVSAEPRGPAQDRQEAAPSPASGEAPSVAILKSGVVDGMAYTLYADGSIEAQLSQGTVRFGSLAELRAHIEKNS